MEPHIVVRRENVFERLYEITEPRTLIGRGFGCRLRLADTCVSREHAVLIYDAGAVEIRDLGSRNGTLINGEPITDARFLPARARVQIGPYELTICDGLPAAIGEIESDENESTQSRRDPLDALSANAHVGRLTPAQRRVYFGFVRGMSEKEIAHNLGLSVHTVHDHAKAIYRALAVSSRGELISGWANSQANKTVPPE